MDEKPFMSHLKELYEQQEGLEKVRTFGWERFCELGLPKVNLKDLYSQKFSLTPGSFSGSIPDGTLVFLNGSYSSEFSNPSGLPKEMVLMPLSKAFQTFGTFLQGRLPKEEKEAFAALNFAFCQEGLFIYLPPKTICEKPLQILEIFEAKTPSLFSPRIHLFAGKQSQIKIYRNNQSRGTYWCNGFYDFSLDENALVHVHHLGHFDENSWHTEALRATLKKQSLFKNLTVTNGSKTNRFDSHISLNGEHSEVFLQGAWLLAGKRQTHFNVLVDHKAPNTSSMQKFKGACKDFSRSSFQGKIKVQKNALKTQGYQANHNLILSDKAIMESQPNLEIFADDVKASHGATVGKLDLENLFYLKSRGLSEEVAKKMLIHGFLKEVIDDVESLSFKEKALKLLE